MRNANHKLIRRICSPHLLLLAMVPLLSGCNVGLFVGTYISAVVAIDVATIPFRALLGTIVLQFINSL